jgi:integrase
MLLTKFFSDHYRPRRLLGKSENTTRLYLISIRSFGKTLERPASIADLSDVNLIRHMQRVIDAGRSPATANKDRAQLITLWRLAYQLKLHDTWPAVPILTEPERTPTAWLSQELQSLLDVVDKQVGDFCGVPRSIWWRAMLLLCLDTGERIGALSIAQWSWVNGEWITVTAEARKGKKRDKTFKLSPDTLAALQALRDSGSYGVKMFPWPYCKMYLWTLYKRLLVEAKLPSGRRDKFHKLRRTTASTVHAAGLDAQDALDHEYRRTTKRYLDPRFQRDRQPCDVLTEYLKNPNPPAERRSGTIDRQIDPGSSQAG